MEKTEPGVQINHNKDTVYIYSDGACRGNQIKQNIGAFAWVMYYNDSGMEYAQADVNTTNNKMELCAVINALAKINNKSIPVIVTTDSQYVVSGVNKWSKKWKQNGFQNSKKENIKNMGYWIWLLDLIDTFDNIEFRHCEGHSDNPYNNRADTLCNLAMDQYISYLEKTCQLDLMKLD